MAYIGNGHQQAPARFGSFATALYGRFAKHGVVKIAGVFAVNRHQRHIGQINTVFFVDGQHLVWQCARHGDAGVRKLMRHTVFAHRNFNLHARVVNFAQHLFDAAHGLSKQSGGLYQFHHHNLPGLGRANGALGNEHVLPVTFVFGGHNPDATFVQQAANDGLRRAFNDFHHAPFGPAFAVAAHHAGLDPVFVQHGTHLVGGQINIRRAVVTDDKTVAITMALYGPFNLIQRRAELLHILDTISLFPEKPRWRNW